MKTAGRRNPNRWVTAPCTPRPWCGWSELSLVHGGWEARKTPAAGEVFFLDFPLYRTSRDLAFSVRQGSASRGRRWRLKSTASFEKHHRRVIHERRRPQLAGHHVENRRLGNFSNEGVFGHRRALFKVWFEIGSQKGPKMRYLKLLSLLGICSICLVAVPHAHAQSNQANNNQAYGGPAYDNQANGNPAYGDPAYGAPAYAVPAPVCPYGYYGYYPYQCAPYGYYGPSYFSGGIFIGAGPWFRGFGGPGFIGRPGYGPGFRPFVGGRGPGFVGRAPVGGGFARGGAVGRAPVGGGFARGGAVGRAPAALLGGGFRGGNNFRGGGGGRSGGNSHGGGSRGGGGSHGGGRR